MIRTSADDDGGWIVFADEEDLPSASLYRPAALEIAGRWVRVGSIGPRGSLYIATQIRKGRPERERWLRILNDARRRLHATGELQDFRSRRELKEEAEHGSFVVELDNGTYRRFHSMRSQNALPRSPSASGWGALDWAEHELKAEHATNADIFRVGEHPPLLLTAHNHLPIHSMTKNAYGHLVMTWPSVIRHAYGAKAQAMELVDQRLFYGNHDVTPNDIAGAWEITEDAFQEAKLPLQEDVARENADYWHERGSVLSRRSARSARTVKRARERKRR